MHTQIFTRNGRTRGIFRILALGVIFCVGWLANRVPAAPAAAAEGSRLQSLDGRWQIAQDTYDVGLSGRWFDPASFPSGSSRLIQVPGTITEAWPNPLPLLKAANLVWYMRTFTSEVEAAPGMRSYLRFGAVRYLSHIWLNGVDLGSHEGGDDPFEFDVTKFLRSGQPNTVIIRVASPFLGGVNQHVSLVAEPDVRIIDGFARPNAQAGAIRLDVTVENNTSAPAVVDLTASVGEYKPSRPVGTQTANATVPPGRSTTTLTLAVPGPHPWNLDDPFLYTISITSRWRGASSEADGRDDCSFRTGFRDFRIIDGYFCLNGRRIFLKSSHGNWYDPVVIQGTPGAMDYLNRNFPQLKKAGFNMMRFITSAALPEQLDQADELGILIYSEHETAWPVLLVADPTKIGISLDQVVRRDRNHPSLAIWGLLNETSSLLAFQRGKALLPGLRAIDDTRVVLLSSGRWDEDFQTGSASNPGSATWDVYLGGEDPIKPVSAGTFKGGEAGGFHPGTGDAHIYNWYPTSWQFVMDFAHLAQDTRPFFLSEAGIGSLYNSIREEQEMKAAGASAGAYAWNWIKPDADGLRKTWKTYGLDSVYPSIEDMLVDSELSASRQRELIFSIVRSNPKVNGYNVTGLNDAWGAGEGVMNNFYEFKAGYLAVFQAGWAPLRWCLFVNPMNAYADEPVHVKVALANEDRLAPGDYPAILKISAAQGIVWKHEVTIRVLAGRDAPLAYPVFDEDVTIPGLAEGAYTLEADLGKGIDAAANALSFIVTSREHLPARPGNVTVLGLDQSAREFLVRHGARLHDYVEGEQIDHEAIVLGDSFTARSAAWRALYARVARGAHAVFLAPGVFSADPAGGGRNPVKWLALSKTVGFNTRNAGLSKERDALYHKEIVAKNVPAFAGLAWKLMTPEYYGSLLENSVYFDAVPVPETTAAVAIRCNLYMDYTRIYEDGVVLGTYRHHAGHFTINGLDILGHLGNPAADRLFLNLVAEAQSDAAALEPLPADYDAEMEALGIRDAF
jgi:hypothetical protein